MSVIELPDIPQWKNPRPIFDKKALNELLIWCTQHEVSDILLESDEPIFVKLYGEVEKVNEEGTSSAELSAVLNDILKDGASSELRAAEELDFAHPVLLPDDSQLRFRVNATSCQGYYGAEDGMELVLRTIPGVPPDAEKIGVEKELLDIFCNKEIGLCLVTGATGSGKSTLLGSIIKKIGQTQKRHILTYEHPIEFALKHIPNLKSKIVQHEIKKHIKTFVRACVNSLRKAPDVIMIGEARDKETVEGVISQCQTGHEVFTTLHTNRAHTTFERMADPFPAEDRNSTILTLIESTKCILHQRLVTKKSGGRIALKEWIKLSEKDRSAISTEFREHGDITSILYRYLNQQGNTLAADATNKFKSGQIDLLVYLNQINQAGNPTAVHNELPTILADMLQRDVITNKEYCDWRGHLEEISNANE